MEQVVTRSRPLLSRSGCIYQRFNNRRIRRRFSSPFIEERLYLIEKFLDFMAYSVLVPFYRGAVVFT